MITLSRKIDAVNAIVEIVDNMAMLGDDVDPQRMVTGMDRLMRHARTVQDYYNQELNDNTGGPDQ